MGVFFSRKYGLLNSSYTITPESTVKAMRIKETMINFRSNQRSNKFSL